MCNSRYVFIRVISRQPMFAPLLLGSIDYRSEYSFAAHATIDVVYVGIIPPSLFVTHHFPPTLNG